MSVVPFIALGLFFLSGAWIFFLLIPAAAALMGGRHHHYHSRARGSRY